jgi:RNA polymerase sigma factor (sigma-70 family)
MPKVGPGGSGWQPLAGPTWLRLLPLRLEPSLLRKLAMFNDIKAVFSRVRAALRRRGASPHDADDWAQEAWLRASQHLQDMAVPNPEAYLTRTAINIGIDAHRSRSAHGEELVLDELFVEDVAPGVEAQLLGKERMDRMWQCLESMPVRTREIFLAHRVGGRTYADIGREFGISATVVGKHVIRATKLLAGWMEGW